MQKLKKISFFREFFSANCNDHKRFGGIRSRINGLGDIGNWGSSRRAVQMRTINGGGNGGTNLGHLFHFSADQFSDAGALLSAQQRRFSSPPAFRRVPASLRLNPCTGDPLPSLTTTAENSPPAAVNSCFFPAIFQPCFRYASLYLRSISLLRTLWNLDDDLHAPYLHVRPLTATSRLRVVRNTFQAGLWHLRRLPLPPATVALVAAESRSFENSYIPENPRTPKPLTFSKTRLRGAKNRSNTSPVTKKISEKITFFFSKTLHMCKKKIPNFNDSKRFEESRSRFFEMDIGLGDIGNWGSSRYRRFDVSLVDSIGASVGIGENEQSEIDELLRMGKIVHQQEMKHSSQEEATSKASKQQQHP
ncbi:hypothetical protein LXL04_023540 [Taraxacum kok-saghyz]